MGRVSRKSLLQSLSDSKEVRATLVGGMAVEDWPQAIEKIKAIDPKAFVEETGVLLSNRRYILKPKIRRVRKGTFYASGNSFSFCWNGNETRGRVSDLQVSVNGKALEFVIGPKQEKVVYEVA